MYSIVLNVLIKILEVLLTSKHNRLGQWPQSFLGAQIKGAQDMEKRRVGDGGD